MFLEVIATSLKDIEKINNSLAVVSPKYWTTFG